MSIIDRRFSTNYVFSSSPDDDFELLYAEQHNRINCFPTVVDFTTSLTVRLIERKYLNDVAKIVGKKSSEDVLYSILTPKNFL